MDFRRFQVWSILQIRLEKIPTDCFVQPIILRLAPLKLLPGLSYEKQKSTHSAMLGDFIKTGQRKNGQIDTWTNGCDMHLTIFSFFFLKFHQLITGGAFLFDERNVIDVIVANRPDNDWQLQDLAWRHRFLLHFPPVIAMSLGHMKI